LRFDHACKTDENQGVQSYLGFELPGLSGELPSEAVMIKKTKEGYQVLSTKGKNLGGPYKTLEEAKKRLRQVEFFKHRGRTLPAKI